MDGFYVQVKISKHDHNFFSAWFGPYSTEEKAKRAVLRIYPSGEPFVIGVGELEA